MCLVGLHRLEAAADESWDAPIRRAELWDAVHAVPVHAVQSSLSTGDSSKVRDHPLTHHTISCLNNDVRRA